MKKVLFVLILQNQVSWIHSYQKKRKSFTEHFYRRWSFEYYDETKLLGLAQVPRLKTLNSTLMLIMTRLIKMLSRVFIFDGIFLSLIELTSCWWLNMELFFHTSPLVFLSGEPSVTRFSYIKFSWFSWLLNCRKESSVLSFLTNDGISHLNSILLTKNSNFYNHLHFWHFIIPLTLYDFLNCFYHINNFQETKTK